MRATQAWIGLVLVVLAFASAVVLVVEAQVTGRVAMELVATTGILGLAAILYPFLARPLPEEGPRCPECNAPTGWMGIQGFCAACGRPRRQQQRTV